MFILIDRKECLECGEIFEKIRNKPTILIETIWVCPECGHRHEGIKIPGDNIKGEKQI